MQRARCGVDVQDGGPGAPGDLRDFGRRVDHAGGAHGDQQVAVFGDLEGMVEGIHRQAFAEPHHAGAQRAAAMGAGRRRYAAPCLRLIRNRQRCVGFALAVETARALQLAVQVGDVLAAGAFVEIVDVLGDQRELRHLARQRCDGQVSGIGLRAMDDAASPFIPAPDQRWVGTERLGGGQGCGVETLPQPAEAVAEGGDTTLGRNTSTAEYHHVMGVAQGVEQCGIEYHGAAPGSVGAFSRRLRPAALARYNARSAASISACGLLSLPPGRVAMPMLAVIRPSGCRRG